MLEHQLRDRACGFYSSCLKMEGVNGQKLSAGLQREISGQLDAQMKNVIIGMVVRSAGVAWTLKVAIKAYDKARRRSILRL